MTRTPIHPGEILADELAELGMSAEALAREIRVPGNRISQIVAGKRGITADTALRLGHWFGTSAEFWINLQKSYELRVAGRKAGKDIAKLPKRPRRSSKTQAAE
jgi:addiction module HigA family antidote